MKLSRRNFLKSSTLGAAGITTIPAIVSSCIEPEPGRESLISQGDVVLFQGDSITDAGREKKRELPNNSRSFGNGYAYIAASELLRDRPGDNLTLYNRGISGNKVFQLAARWVKDCVDLEPDVLSILIGVNDYWHFRNGKYDGTPEIYENDYRSLLKNTLQELPETKLVICQPFILANTSAVDDSWLEPFREYQEIAKKLSGEFNTAWVPFQDVFNQATKYAPETYWLPDGVHPSMAGAQLMAETWLSIIG
jgi:lysophospholipase L1-like esterase